MVGRIECCDITECCRADDCSGVDLIQSLLPNGPLWNMNAQTEHAAYWRATAEVFTELNKALCQEFAETNPCTSSRLLTMWAQVYCFPDCVELTTQRLCEFLALIFDPECPIGTIGFYKKVLAWVMCATDETCGPVILEVNQRGAHAAEWRADFESANENTFVVIAPPSCYMYDKVKDCYFIPQVECLRRYVFPMGITLGYQTDPVGPNGEDVYNVPPENLGTKPQVYYECERQC